MEFQRDTLKFLIRLGNDLFFLFHLFLCFKRLILLYGFTLLSLEIWNK